MTENKLRNGSQKKEDAMNNLLPQIYDELIRKSEQAKIHAKKCSTLWSIRYWNDVSEKLLKKAMALPIDKSVGVY